MTQADGQRIRAFTACRLDAIPAEEYAMATETLAIFSLCSPLCGECLEKYIGERGWSKQRIRRRIVTGIALLVQRELAELIDSRHVRIFVPLPGHLAARILRTNTRIWAGTAKAIEKHGRN